MIYQRKGNIFLYLIYDVISRINIKVKNNMTKTHFFTFIFQTSISGQIMNLKIQDLVYM